MSVMNADFDKIQLVVRMGFGPYQKGDHITDRAEVEKWAKSHPEYVIAKPYDRPAPEAPVEAPVPVETPVFAEASIEAPAEG